MDNRINFAVIIGVVLVLAFAVTVHKAGYKHGQTDMCFEIGHETDFDPLTIRTCKKIKIELTE